MTSKIGIARQARRLARLPNPEKRIAAGERLCELLDAAIKRMDERQNAPLRRFVNGEWSDHIGKP